MADHIIFNVSTNRGYSADQVLNETITLNDLKAALEQAIEDFGGDKKVVLHNGDNYGASYGVLTPWVDLFEQEEIEEDEF